MRPWPKGRAGVALLALAGWLLPAAAEEGGYRNEMGEVRLPSLAIGKTYSTWHLAQPPLVVRNDSDDTLRVHVDVVVPARHELHAGALPVPDRGWVRLASDHLVLPPHVSERTDVSLTLPYDPDLAGHTYQVDLWTAPVGADGSLGAGGHRHRLLFTVEMDYRDDTEIDFASRDLAPRPAL